MGMRAWPRREAWHRHEYAKQSSQKEGKIGGVGEVKMVMVMVMVMVKVEIMIMRVRVVSLWKFPQTHDLDEPGSWREWMRSKGCITASKPSRSALAPGKGYIFLHLEPNWREPCEVEISRC